MIIPFQLGRYQHNCYLCKGTGYYYECVRLGSVGGRFIKNCESCACSVDIINETKLKIKKENDNWVLISPCGNFKEQYTSLSQIYKRIGEMK